jgi:hypothetical protein
VLIRSAVESLFLPSLLCRPKNEKVAVRSWDRVLVREKERGVDRMKRNHGEGWVDA